MQATVQPPQRAPDGAPVHHERHRPEQTTLCRLVQQHAANFFAQAEEAAGADLPQFVKAERLRVFRSCPLITPIHAHSSLPMLAIAGAMAQLCA